MSWGRLQGSPGTLAGARGVLRGQGKPRDPERWPERSGRGLEGDLCFTAFLSRLGLLTGVLGSFPEESRDGDAGARGVCSSQGSLELQNGGLTALGEAWKAASAWQLSCQLGLLTGVLGSFPDWLLATGCWLAAGWLLLAVSSWLYLLSASCWLLTAAPGC